MQKIMIVEDDPVIRDELALLLSNEGYQTIAIAEFANVAAQVSEHDPNLILLDLNLPERDGLSLCADIRKAGSTPIIFVTSRDSTADELHALSLGGDDYITKPYNGFQSVQEPVGDHVHDEPGYGGHYLDGHPRCLQRQLCGTGPVPEGRTHFQ